MSVVGSKQTSGEGQVLADIVEKVFLGRRAKAFGAADAFRSHGPRLHHLTKKPPLQQYRRKATVRLWDVP
jgi:hypothetical protein